MKGGILPSVMIRPLIIPASAPTASIRRTACHIPQPCLSIIRAPQTALSATIDPTERSMPPVRMTKVIPTPRMAVSDAWRATLSQLPLVMKTDSWLQISMLRMIRLRAGRMFARFGRRDLALGVLAGGRGVVAGALMRPLPFLPVCLRPHNS